MRPDESREYLTLLDGVSVCRSYTIHARGGVDWIDITGTEHHADSVDDLRRQIAAVIMSHEEE